MPNFRVATVARPWGTFALFSQPTLWRAWLRPELLAVTQY
jgi:hypothetical protein